MSGGLQSNFDSGNEHTSEADWNPPPVFDSEKDVNQANDPRNNPEDPESNSSGEISSSEGEISSYFQTPRPAVQMAERKDRPWSPPPVSDSEKHFDQANDPRNNTKDPESNSSGGSSSSEGQISPYFQRPQPAVQLADRKDRPEKKTHSTHQQQSLDQKCFNCAKYGRVCVGTYPFTEKCDSCRNQRRKCYPQDEGQKKPQPQPAEEKCYPCRQKRYQCDGTYPFAQKCSSCQKGERRCTAEKPERLETGLPKDQKCQCCAKNGYKCVGEPPFEYKCASCKAKKSRCYAQGIEVPKTVPDEERCIACNIHNHKRRCDGKKPCTPCTTRSLACNYKDGNVKWTYLTDPEKWKPPTSPDCQGCLRYNQTHFGSSLHCDGNFPCNSCLEERVKTKSSSCTYHYENGVSKYWRLEGEYAQGLRKAKSERRQRRAERQKIPRSEIQVQNSQNEKPAEGESISDEDLLLNDTGYKDNSQSDSDNDSNPEEDPDSADDSDRDDDDSDAKGNSSNNKHPNQYHDRDHEPDQGKSSRLPQYPKQTSTTQEQSTPQDPQPKQPLSHQRYS